MGHVLQQSRPAATDTDPTNLEVSVVVAIAVLAALAAVAVYVRARELERGLTVALVTAAAGFGLAFAVARALGVEGTILLIVALLAAASTAVVAGQRIQRDLKTRRDDAAAAGARLAAVVAEGEPTLQLRPASDYTPGGFGADISEHRHAGDGPEVIPEYVGRSVDLRLRRALERAVDEEGDKLVLLLGPPSSGKSRTMYEAVRSVLPDWYVLPLRTPSMDMTDDAARSPIATLIELRNQISADERDKLLIWIDDAHEHVLRGLTVRRLDELSEAFPAAVVAVTAHEERLQDLALQGTSTGLLHRRLSDAIVGRLSSRLGEDDDLEKFRALYPELAERSGGYHLAEMLVSLDRLKDRYRSGSADAPAGVAVVDAALSWARAGMGPDIPLDELALFVNQVTLASRAPTRPALDETAFREALHWATTPIAHVSSLVHRSQSDPGSVRAFDALIDWVDDVGAPLQGDAWEFVLTRMSPSDGFAVGFSAHLTNRLDHAQMAYLKAVHGNEPDAGPRALVNLGGLYELAEDFDEAARAYDAARASGHPDVVALATYNRAVLHEREQSFDAALDLYKLVIDSEKPDDVLAARSIANTGSILTRSGRTEEARAYLEPHSTSEHVVVAASSRMHLGVIDLNAGDLDAAREHLEFASTATFGLEGVAALNLGNVYLMLAQRAFGRGSDTANQRVRDSTSAGSRRVGELLEELVMEQRAGPGDGEPGP